MLRTMWFLQAVNKSLAAYEKLRDVVGIEALKVNGPSSLVILQA